MTGSPSPAPEDAAIPVPVVTAKKKGSKLKLAPRSSLQYKVGPSFTATKQGSRLYAASKRKLLKPQITARVDRGFDMLDSKWVGYKRNYFTLVSSFSLEEAGDKIFTTDTFKVEKNGLLVDVNYFAMRLVARCHEDKSVVSLVQHTAKRDKGPQMTPPVFPIVPGELPDHETIRSVANIRNDSKIEKSHRLFFVEDDFLDSAKGSILDAYPRDQPTAKIAKYERIQFQGIETNRRLSMTNKHCVLEVQLLGEVGNGDFEVISFCETPPLVIRGRSPSNYLMTKKPAQPRKFQKYDNRLENKEVKEEEESEQDQADSPLTPMPPMFSPKETRVKSIDVDPAIGELDLYARHDRGSSESKSSVQEESYMPHSYSGSSDSILLKKEDIFMEDGCNKENEYTDPYCPVSGMNKLSQLNNYFMEEPNTPCYKPSVRAHHHHQRSKNRKEHKKRKHSKKKKSFSHNYTYLSHSSFAEFEEELQQIREEIVAPDQDHSLFVSMCVSLLEQEPSI